VLVILDWVVGFGGNNEVGWDELRPLMEQLVEGVLCIGGWLAEEDWTGSVVDHFALAVNRLAVGLHGELLEVSWEAMQVLVKPEN